MDSALKVPQSANGSKLQSQPNSKPTSQASQNRNRADSPTKYGPEGGGAEDYSPQPSAGRKSVRIKQLKDGENVTEDDIVDGLEAQLEQLKEAFAKSEDKESQKMLKDSVQPFMQQVGQILFTSEIKEVALNREIIRAALEKRLTKQAEQEQGIRFHEFYDELRAVTIAIVNKPNVSDLTVKKRGS